MAHEPTSNLCKGPCLLCFLIVFALYLLHFSFQPLIFNTTGYHQILFFWVFFAKLNHECEYFIFSDKKIKKNENDA